MSLAENIEGYLSYSLMFIGHPYIWGAIDCSGFVQECLACAGMDPPGDQSAQSLYNVLSPKWENKLIRGSILFFGKSTSTITHTAIALSESTMIEAGGGGKNVTNFAQALKNCAFVRIRPIRHDLVGHLYPVEQNDYIDVWPLKATGRR